jgi:hypothetical protein
MAQKRLGAKSMLLKEFFGPAIKAGNKMLDSKEKSSEQNDDLFWYILDHDKLHKDYFLPLAQKIKKQHNENKLDRTKCSQEFMPMVEKGCMEYYNKKKLTGKLGKIFPKELREDLCEKLFDHYYEDILKDSYSLGM